MKFMSCSGILCVICYLLSALSTNPIIGLIGCILCGFSVGIMWPGTISISSKTFPKGGTAMFSLLAMAGDLGGSIGPGIVGRITQYAEIISGLAWAADLFSGNSIIYAVSSTPKNKCNQK